MDRCPLFETCSKLRKAAEKKFKEEEVYTGDRTTCYNPTWILKNNKKCENFNPELKQLKTEKKTAKKKKTDADFHEVAKQQISETSTSVGVIERCLKASIINKEEILKELIRIFPNVKESKHRRKIPLTIKYLKETGRI